MPMKKHIEELFYSDRPTELTSEDFFSLIGAEFNPNYWSLVRRARGTAMHVELNTKDYTLFESFLTQVVQPYSKRHLSYEIILQSDDIELVKNVDKEEQKPNCLETNIRELFYSKHFFRKFCEDESFYNGAKLAQLKISFLMLLNMELENLIVWSDPFELPSENFYCGGDQSKLGQQCRAPVGIYYKIEINNAIRGVVIPSIPDNLGNVEKWRLFAIVISLVRQLARQSALKKYQSQRQIAAEKSRLSAITYVDTLMSRHESLLVFRLNCFVPLMDGYEASAKLAKTWLKKLANNRRNNALFDEMLGYIWKLDFNFKFGCYLHFIFFYKTNPWTSVHELSHQIGSYWQSQLAKGDPSAFYLTEDELPRGKLTRRFGTVSYDNHQLRWQLDQLIHYLSHKDLYMQFGGSSKEKRFGRGLLPSEGVTDSEEVSESGAIPEV